LADKKPSLLEQAYQSALATLARATLVVKPGQAGVEPGQIRAAEAIIERYDREVKAKKEAASAATDGAESPASSGAAGPPEKVRLTESGAAALKAWMADHSVSLARLGEGTKTHAMWIKRLVRREGLATLEQIARVVACAGGELTAGQLVGMEIGAHVPQLQAVGLVAPTGQAVPISSAPGTTIARPAPVYEVPKGTPVEMLEQAISNTRGDTARARLIVQLIKIKEQTAAPKEDGAAIETDLELVRRFEDLLYHCQRQWVEADDIAKKAEDVKTGTGGLP
jgi:hypothetical protein